MTDDPWGDLGAEPNPDPMASTSGPSGGRSMRPSGGRLFPKGCLPKLFLGVFGVTFVFALLVAGVAILTARTATNVLTLANDMVMNEPVSQDGRERGEEWPSASTTTVLAPPVTVISPPTGAGEEGGKANPPNPPDNPGPFEFMFLQPDGTTPVRWDPCKPIHYVVNNEGAPAGSDGIIEAGLSRVAAATGLTFIFDGPTTEEWPKEAGGGLTEPRFYTKERYGDRFAPVLFDWGTPESHPTRFGPSAISPAAGWGGPEPIYDKAGGFVYVTGEVLIDADYVRKVLADPGYPDYFALSTMMHEVGHVMGLMHVGDPAQIMHPGGIPNPAQDWGSGDLAGLNVLAKGNCYPDGL